MKISELIVKLEKDKEEYGDLEVFMPNIYEDCWDSISKTIRIGAQSGTQKDNVVALIPGKAYLKTSGTVSFTEKP